MPAVTYSQGTDALCADYIETFFAYHVLDVQVNEVEHDIFTYHAQEPGDRFVLDTKDLH